MADPKDERDELFLLDGNSLAYRAFFALPESIATTDGRPTNALFGFSSMLVKIISDHRPAGLVVAWDAGMSGREQVYPEYKAQRPPKPDLLSEQWPHLMPMVEAFGYTNVKVPGYEADDVIATLSELAAADGIPVIVVSGDRDVYQLVHDGVKVMTTGRGVTDTKLYDREAVIERWGVPPELVTDLIGLKGDTSDNIPGVPGIGEKTAAGLLQEFGSLEEVLANVDKISGPKRKQNLIEHAEDARISKRLATMEREIDIDIDLPGLMGAEPDRGALREMMREFELRAILQRLEEALPEGEAVPGRAVQEEVAVKVREADLGELPKGSVAVAIRGRRWAAAPVDFKAEASAEAGPGAEVLVGEAETGEVVSALAQRELVGHDLKSLGGGRHGLFAAAAASGMEPRLAHDTLVGAYLIEPARRTYDLIELAADAGIGVGVTEGAGESGEEPEQLELGAAGETEAGLDAPAEARLVAALAEHQRRRLEADGLIPLLEKVELPLVPVLAAMERRGLKLDVERLAEIGAGLSERIADLETEIHQLAGHPFTIGSPQQVGTVLFEELGLSRKRRGKTGFSTDARVLAQIRDEHPIVAKIEAWRELSKLKSTYLDSLPEVVDPNTGRIHTTFSQTTAATGRLSSTAPNLQNIPIRTEVGRPVRGCFVAEAGSLLLSADYSQVELRVLAHVADEEVLKEIFRAGDDVHAATAAEVFAIAREDVDIEQRSKAKMVNFGIIYGLTGFGLADRLNIPRQEGDEFVARYLERFPAVRDFRERAIEQGREQGYVTTVMGRRRLIPELRSSRYQTRQLGERLAVNTVVQGSAADIIKLAMIRCERALAEADLETRLILQIHDELLFEGPPQEMDEATAIVRREMIAAYRLDPPLEVEVGVGPDWLSLK